MLRFAANITFLFSELPLLQRFAAARRAGFEAVEFQGPESATAPQIAAAAAAAGVSIVSCNCPVGDWMSGGPGLSGVPGRQEEYRDALRWTADFAQRVSCPAVNIGPSRVPKGVGREECLSVLAENLGFAAALLGRGDIRVLVEPLNRVDYADVLLFDVHDAVKAMDASGHANVSLQFDLYHVHQMCRDPLDVLGSHLARIGHVQFADVPGRGPPGTGRIDFGAFFGALSRLGYRHWIGAEYRPGIRTEETLGWLQRHTAVTSSQPAPY